MKKLIAILVILQFSSFCISQDSIVRVPINSSDTKVEFIGKLRKKLGTVSTIVGVVVDEYRKGYASGLNVIVQMIDDSSVQQLIQIPVSPYFGKFGDSGVLYTLPKLTPGETYRLRVYETGEFWGKPWEAYKEAGLTFSTRGHYFQNKLVVISGRKVDAVRWHPEKFLGRDALLSGTAVNEGSIAVIKTPEWKLRLLGSGKWEDSQLGKPAEVLGKVEYAESENIFFVRDAQPRLVNLIDQVGKKVSLRGRVINSNEKWWFDYRGTDIYVENLEKLPGWSGRSHFRIMEISGILEQAVLPVLRGPYSDDEPAEKLQFIVRNPTWIPIPELLSPEEKLLDE